MSVRFLKFCLSNSYQKIVDERTKMLLVLLLDWGLYARLLTAWRTVSVILSKIFRSTGSDFL